MNLPLFKKAKATYQGGLVTLFGTGRRADHFAVQDADNEHTHYVTQSRHAEGTVFSCDCTFQSLPREKNLKNGQQPLCTHIIAVVMYVYFHTPKV